MPDSLTRRLELIASINDQIAPLVAQAHADDPAFTLKTKTTPTLKIFPNTKGHALYTVRRLRNGTLQLRPTPADEPNVRIMDLAKLAYQDQISVISKELFNRTLQSPLHHELVHTLAKSKGAAAHISGAFRNIAEQVIVQYATSSQIDGIAKPIHDHKHRAAITQALRKHIANAIIIQLQNSGIRHYAYEHSVQWVTFHQYNDFALNTRTYHQMELEAPNVLRAFRNISRNNAAPQHFPTPDHITQLVREACHLTPAQWRIFTRTTYTSTDEPERHIAVLRTAIKLLTDVNLPVCTPGFPESIIRMYSRHEWALNHPSTCPYGEVRHTWVHIFHQAIANHNESTKQQRYYESCQRHINLTNILDAFVYSVQNDLPWGHTDWNSHIRRSRRIHARMVAEIDFQNTNPDSLATWESLVHSAQIDDYDVTAVNDGVAVKNLAASMHNCLARYIPECQKGQLRIFSIHQKQRLVAAFALNQQSGRWAVWQVEKPHSRAAQPAHIAVAVKFADHYNIVESRYAVP